MLALHALSVLSPLPWADFCPTAKEYSTSSAPVGEERQLRGERQWNLVSVGLSTVSSPLLVRSEE